MLCECCGVSKISAPKKVQDGKIYVCSACYATHYHNDRETQLLILSQPISAATGQRKPVPDKKAAEHLGIDCKTYEAEVKVAEAKLRERLKKRGVGY